MLYLLIHNFLRCEGQGNGRNLAGGVGQTITACPPQLPATVS